VPSTDIQGKDVILTGQAPIWLYLKIAHELHGIVKSISMTLRFLENDNIL